MQIAVSINKTTNSFTAKTSRVSQHQNCWISCGPQELVELLFTLPPVPALSSSPLAAMPADIITGMAHLKVRFYARCPFLPQPDKVTSNWLYTVMAWLP